MDSSFSLFENCLKSGLGSGDVGGSDHSEDIFNGHTLTKIMHSYQGFDNVDVTMPYCRSLRLTLTLTLTFSISMLDRFDFIIKSDYFKNLNVHATVIIAYEIQIFNFTFVVFRNAQ